MERPICILREPEGLVALVLPRPPEVEAWVRVPLHALSETAAPGATALRACWEALGHARGATPETLAQLLLVLVFTVPGDPQGSVTPGHPWLEPPPAAPRRTAAHPRGYRGTIHQPPKRAAPELLDVRPHLLHRRTTQALLATLLPHGPEALRLLAGWTLPEGWKERVSRSLEDLEGGPLGVRRAGVPNVFRRLACLLEGVERGFERLMALRGRLALDPPPRLHVIAARMVRHWGPEAGLAWLERAARLEPQAQTRLLSELSQVEPVPAERVHRYDLQMETFASEHAAWRGDYLRGLHAGLPSDYLLSGFRLLAAHGVGSSLGTPSRAGPVPEAALTALFAHLRPVMSGHALLESLWRLCGELPGFGAALETFPWTTLTPEAAYCLVVALSALSWNGAPRQGWSLLRPLLRRLPSLMERTPGSHQARCIQMLLALLEPGGPERPPAWLEATALALAGRLCHPPFAMTDILSSVLGTLVRHPTPEVRERLLRVPERSLLRLEARCTREDLAVLVADGLKALVAQDVRLVLEALESCPETLARTARLLGTLPRHEQIAALRDFAAHPLACAEPSLESASALVTRLRGREGRGVDSPLPRRARLALEQGWELSAGQLARAMRRVEEQWPRVRLQVLTHQLWERLRGGGPADLGQARVRHALQMASLLTHNRRGLRRLLAHCFAGDPDSISRHPASLDWLRRHPRLSPEMWRTGLVLRRAVPGLGEVTLALEQDPLEALQLGTYVGSCFGLNGLCDSSAAAVVLDFNKRVLYARDSQARVLARQLLAISQDDTLVPFRVYPERTPPALQALFREYDGLFSQALGLPLFEGSEDPSIGDAPPVECILSRSFWHDGAWVLGGAAPESSSHRP